MKECVKNKNQLVSGEACCVWGGVVAVKSDSPPWLVRFLGTQEQNRVGARKY